MTTPTPDPQPRTGLLSRVEAKIKEVWHDLDGDARQELKRLLADAKTEAAKVEADVKADVREQVVPRLQQLKTEAEQALQGALPDISADVTRVVETAIGDIGHLIGSDL